jgi:hypothetical protein
LVAGLVVTVAAQGQRLAWSDDAPSTMAAAIYLSVEDVLGEIKVDFGDEKIKLRTRNSTRDEIFQRIAAERKLTLRFYCFDPVSTTEKLSANRQFPSINALLEWIANQALEIDLADPTGAATKAIADASTIDARPRDCDPEGGPVRTYRDWHSVPGLRGVGAEADLAVLSEILAKEGPLTSSRRPTGRRRWRWRRGRCTTRTRKWS